MAATASRGAVPAARCPARGRNAALLCPGHFRRSARWLVWAASSRTCDLSPRAAPALPRGGCEELRRKRAPDRSGVGGPCLPERRVAPPTRLPELHANTGAPQRVRQPTGSRNVRVWKRFGAVESGRGLLLAVGQGAVSEGRSQELVTEAGDRSEGCWSDPARGVSHPAERCASALAPQEPAETVAAHTLGHESPSRCFAGGRVMRVYLVEWGGRWRTLPGGRCLQPPKQPTLCRRFGGGALRDRHRFWKFKWKACLEIPVNFLKFFPSYSLAGVLSLGLPFNWNPGKLSFGKIYPRYRNGGREGRN